MQSIAILFGFLAAYSIAKTSAEEIRSTSVFYNKLEELFQAFNNNDTERMDVIFKAIETNNSTELNGLLNTNATTSGNYERDLKSYVVR